MRFWPYFLAVIGFLLSIDLGFRLQEFGATLGAKHVPEQGSLMGMILVYLVHLPSRRDSIRLIPQPIRVGFVLFFAWMLTFVEMTMAWDLHHEAPFSTYLRLAVLDFCVGIFGYVMFTPAAKLFAAHVSAKQKQSESVIDQSVTASDD